MGSFLDGWGVEVDEEAEGLVGEAEVGNKLGEVEVVDGADGFEFEDDVVLDEQIDPLGWELLAFVIADESELLLIFDACSIELLAECSFVHRFKQSDTELLVHFDRAADDLMAELVQCSWKFDPVHSYLIFNSALSA